MTDKEAWAAYGAGYDKVDIVNLTGEPGPGRGNKTDDNINCLETGEPEEISSLEFAAGIIEYQNEIIARLQVQVRQQAERIQRLRHF